MNILVKDVRVFDVGIGNLTPLRDVVLTPTGICAPDPALYTSQTICGAGGYLLPGLIELSADFKYPGYENIYTLEDGQKAALCGGYSKVMLEPCGKPVLDDPFYFPLQRLQNSPVCVEAYGACSRKLEHTQLSEIGLLQAKGVLGFSDAGKPIVESSFLKSLFAYSSRFGCRLFLTPLDPGLCGKHTFHEGAVADTLGISGIPEMAETLQVIRLLEFAKYYGTPIHLRQITSPSSLQWITQYRAKGVDVTLDIDIHNLCLTDETLFLLDSHYHLNTPLRSQEMVAGVYRWLAEGHEAAFSTHHCPVLPQDKEHSLEESVPGAVGMEVALSVFNTFIAPRLSAGFIEFYRYLVAAPARALGANKASADFFLWNPDVRWVAQAQTFAGCVHNSPFLEKELRGQVVGCYFNGSWNA
jgi:dihydroorotase